MKEVRSIKKSIVFSLVFCLFVLVFKVNVLALKNDSQDSQVQFTGCTLNEEYIEWEKLSDEEKNRL